LNYLEANAWIKKENDAIEDRDLVLLSSGFMEPLDIYLRAYSIKHGIKLNVEYLPFNTLRQSLSNYLNVVTNCAFILSPWDFCHELDWRTGIPEESRSLEILFEESKEFLDLLLDFKEASFFYFNSCTPPIFSNQINNDKLNLYLENLVLNLNAEIISERNFSLGTYLNSGCFSSGEYLGNLASTIVSAALKIGRTPKKVLITDLDNTLWNGVVAEEGVSSIKYDSDGSGFKHFIYQTFLKKIKAEGTLLAAVSRNNPKDALMPLKEGKMKIKEADFVAVVASYEAKSSQIISLGKSLNLLLDSFIFVDDSQIEIEEVRSKIPEVECYLFPKSDNDIPKLINTLSRKFTKTNITQEDRVRTKMYRSQLKTFQASTKKGSDISAYLKKLNMELLITDRTMNIGERAEQLIQKTSQFNLNGARFSNIKIEQLLKRGGKLYTGRLKDQTGDHGEILVCLLSSDNIIKSFVMSCRVFQRRVEYAFLSWLCEKEEFHSMDFLLTDRNLPFQNFLEESGIVTKVENGLISIDRKQIVLNFNKWSHLFRIHVI
jgi:FkbH-like protein